MEEVKKKLYDYPYVCECIKQSQEEVAHLGVLIRAERDTSKAIQMREVTIHTNDISDPTQQAVERIIDRYEKQVTYLEQQLEELYDQKKKVEGALRQLNELERRIIKHRYFNLTSWAKIKTKLKYERSALFKIHTEAIEKVNNFMKLRTKMD